MQEPTGVKSIEITKPPVKIEKLKPVDKDWTGQGKGWLKDLKQKSDDKPQGVLEEIAKAPEKKNVLVEEIEGSNLPQKDENKKGEAQEEEKKLSHQEEIQQRYNFTSNPEKTETWGDYTLLSATIGSFEKALLLAKPLDVEGFQRFARILTEDITQSSQLNDVFITLDREFTNSPLLDKAWRESIESALSKGSELIELFLSENGRAGELKKALKLSQLNLRPGIDTNKIALASTDRRLMDFSIDSAKSPDIWEHESLHLLQHEGDEKNEFTNSIHDKLVKSGHNVQQETGGLGGRRRLEADSKGDVAKSCIEGVTEWARMKLHHKYKRDFTSLPENPYSKHIQKAETFFTNILVRAEKAGAVRIKLENDILLKVVSGDLPNLLTLISIYKDDVGKDTALELGEMFLDLGVKW